MTVSVRTNFLNWKLIKSWSKVNIENYYYLGNILLSFLIDLYTQINGKPTIDSNVCHMPSQQHQTQYKVENMYTCVVKDKSMLGKGNSWYIGKP